LYGLRHEQLFVTNDSDQNAACVFLIVDEEVIYKIAPNSVLNIGRLDTNDIVLDDYKVSREHAVLKFTQSEVVLVDLASTHGSSINGVRLDRGPVEFGDTIQIVSHELVISREIPADVTTDTSSVPRPKMVRTLDRRLKFFGGLNEFPLITLVQFLHQEKQSGLLLLELGQLPSARIYMQEGEITHVVQGENLAELMVRQVHNESLFFYFHHETDFPPRTVTQSTPNYLMALCQSHDEKKRRELDEATLRRGTKTGGVPLRVEEPLVW
jgi:pSer/pThr/pTyr-binding forkhead associated (FHA) protein